MYTKSAIEVQIATWNLISVWCSLKLRLCVLDFVLQIWRKVRTESLDSRVGVGMKNHLKIS